MSTGFSSAKLDVPRREAGVVGQRMAEDVDPVRAQHVEKPLGVADAGDGVHLRARKRPKRQFRGRRTSATALFASSRMLSAPSSSARPPFTTIASATASRERVSRSGPAGSSQPLPKRRSPSMTTTSQSRARA